MYREIDDDDLDNKSDDDEFIDGLKKQHELRKGANKIGADGSIP
jgi:hypothetical protein